jgi:mutator protein MutT
MSKREADRTDDVARQPDDSQVVAREPAIQVLAAVIRRGDHWLVCKRPSHKRHGGLWEFPGGKLEPGESWVEAAKRELLEELGVAVTSVGDPIASKCDPDSPFEIVFVPVRIEGEPQPIEHDEVRLIESSYCW